MKSETMTSVGMPRRTFLRNSLMMTLPMMAGTSLLGFAGKAAAATQPAYVPPTRQRGTTLLNAQAFCAVGDGVHDDTSALQAAINALPSTGGTVFIPAGTYLVDAVRSVQLRSLMHLQMDPAAKLVAKTTSSDSYNVLLADVLHDVEISGGQIVGERDSHIGTIGEGGHGIRIRGCQRVTIRDIICSKGWGDGITVGPRPNFGKTFTYSADVVLANVVCTGNRRNGVSIGDVNGMKVYDSEFSNTTETKHQCGIDVEPSPDIDGSGRCDDVHIENCNLAGNAAYGINIWKNTYNIVLTKCMIQNNRTCGMVTRGLNGATFSDNTICNNMSTGMFIQIDSKNVVISGNTSFRNYLKQTVVPRTAFWLTGTATKIKKDLIVGTGTSNIQVGSNLYATQ